MFSFFRSSGADADASAPPATPATVQLIIHTDATGKLLRPLGAMVKLGKDYEGDPLNAFMDFEDWYAGVGQEVIDDTDTYILTGNNFKFCVRRDAITSYRIEVQ